MTSHVFGALPPKNGPLSSSIGSVATITTVADKAAEDPEECGRVGGWVASFDKLLEDPLGVHALLVSQLSATGKSCRAPPLQVVAV